MPTLPDAEAVSESVKGWVAAQPNFARLLKAGMSVERALYRWGLDLLRAKQIPEAISALRAALSLARLDPVLWLNYSMALADGGALAESAACLEYSLKLLPRQPATWLMLGMARKKLGDLGG